MSKVSLLTLLSQAPESMVMLRKPDLVDVLKVKNVSLPNRAQPILLLLRFFCIDEHHAQRYSPSTNFSPYVFRYHLYEVVLVGRKQFSYLSHLLTLHALLIKGVCRGIYGVIPRSRDEHHTCRLQHRSQYVCYDNPGSVVAEEGSPSIFHSSLIPTTYLPGYQTQI